MRAGTENTLGIIGFGKAIEMRSREMEDEAERLLGLKKTLRRGLEEAIPGVCFSTATPKIRFPGLSAHLLPVPREKRCFFIWTWKA